MLGCILALATSASADVLRDHDNGPLTGIFGIPDSTEGGRLLRAGESAWELSITHASHSVFEARPSEALYLDGETSRFEFRYRKAIGNKLELGVELPYMQHQPGKLDSFIDSFHNIFGMPEGNRPDRGHDLLDFRYADLTGLHVYEKDSSAGIGDTRLFGGWKLLTSDRHQMALRFGVKLPTGDSARLHGSGGTDVSVGVAGDVNRLFGTDRLTGFYRMHAIHLGEPDVLANRYQDWAAYVSTGIGFQAGQRIELLLQGAVRTAVYDSVIHSLGGNSTTVTFGTNIDLSNKYQLSVAITEDADVASAPDVAFQIALRYRGAK
ncbi:MAG: hypothetical protein ACI88G_000955 [Woeseiaceae bacterium]|jgi:hypothetical protein